MAARCERPHHYALAANFILPPLTLATIRDERRHDRPANHRRDDRDPLMPIAAAPSAMNAPRNNSARGCREEHAVLRRLALPGEPEEHPVDATGCRQFEKLD